MTLNDIVGSCTDEGFIKEYWGRSLLHISGNRDKFTTLFSWNMLNNLLNHNEIVPGERINIVKQGTRIEPSRYARSRNIAGLNYTCISAPDVINFLREGATLVIAGVDECCAPIAQLAGELEFRLQTNVAVNMYASWGLAHGFDLHYDDHDVFVLQIAGEKHWKVYGPTQLYPVERFTSESNMPQNGPLWENVLGTGDALYLPRGWWHIASPRDVPTIHLTVGFKNVTGIDMFQWLLNRLVPNESMRQDVPLLAPCATQEAYCEAIREAFNQVCGGATLVKEYLRYLNGTTTPRRHFGLPWGIEPATLDDSHGDLLIIVNLARPIYLEPAEESGYLKVRFDGREFRYADITGVLFTFLTENRCVSISTLCKMFASKFDVDQIREFITDLARQGFLTLAGPHLKQDADLDTFPSFSSPL